MNLVIVGSIAFDDIITPFGESGKILGGAGTFIALSASLLEVENALVSVVGEDFPTQYLDLLRDKGTNIEGVQVKKGEKTFFWKGEYHNDMNARDTLITELNALESFEPKVPENWKSPEVLLLGNLHPIVQMKVLEQLKEEPKVTILDTMNFWMDTALEDLLKIISKTTILTINDEEARQLSGEYSLKKAASKILKMGPMFLIIKKGEHGALLFSKEDVFFAPALPLDEVYDPTGAGDTFAGGFSAFLSKTKDYTFENMKRAVIFGSALASFTVEKFGTERLQSLTRDELADRIKIFRKLSQFNLNLEEF